MTRDDIKALMRLIMRLDKRYTSMYLKADSTVAAVELTEELSMLRRVLVEAIDTVHTNKKCVRPEATYCDPDHKDCLKCTGLDIRGDKLPNE